MACGVAKAQQQSVPKKSGGEKATKVHERVNLDISMIKSLKDVKVKVTKPN